VAVTADFEGCLCAVSQSVRDSGSGAVLVDFTHPSVVYEHTRAAIAYGVHPVIGTTGLSLNNSTTSPSFRPKLPWVGP
jgi:4-hydroxy-tetrahydrodipicolinate reductase